MTRSRQALCALLWLAAAAGPAAPIYPPPPELDIVAFGFTPHVIRSDRTEPVTFEATVKGQPTKVGFEYAGAESLMRDDGTGGDLRAGDGVYTIVFRPEQITGKLKPSDVYRPFLGFCKVYREEKVVVRLNVFAEVWTPALPTVKVRSLGPDAQASAHLVNLVEQMPPGRFDPKTGAERFYAVYPDEYDFLNIILLPAWRYNRHHIAVQNKVKGLGMALCDETKEYGSGGRLQGISVFPISAFFDGAGWAYQHELAHQWMNFLRGTPFEPGIPHWPLSDVASGMLGISLGGPNSQGGLFPFRLVPEGDKFRLVQLTSEETCEFNDLELYLMGLLPADQVKPHFVFNNQAQQPRAGALFRGPVTWVTIDDLRAAVGPRDPDCSRAPKRFRIATIVVSDVLLPAEEMSFYDFFAARAELRGPAAESSGFYKGIARPFYLSTGKRGELDTRIGERLRAGK